MAHRELILCQLSQEKHEALRATMSYKKWLIIATSLFGVGFTLGLVTPPGIFGPFTDMIAGLEEFANLLTPLPQFAILVIIFITNATTLLVSFILSPIFCLWPILVLTLNGWLLAFVSMIVAQEESLGFVLVGLVPHGIVELPAFILGQAAALSFGTTVILALFKKRRELILPSFKQNLRYLLIALALLLPAAIIETYITPLLLT